MKEHPILFTTDMVRAILDGSKTQTRRVLANQPIDDKVFWEPEYPGGAALVSSPLSRQRQVWRCSYGVPGGRLWVRELWYYDIPPHRLPREMPEDFDADALYFRADGECCEQIPECSCAEVGKPKWRHGMFLPRWASRITLEVTDVRVQRVQEISAEDILDEGVHVPRTDDGKVLLRITGKYPPCDYMGDETLGPKGQWPDEIRDKPDFLRAHFASLWDSINAKRGYPWKSNPWVWAITFKVLEVKGRVAA